MSDSPLVSFRIVVLHDVRGMRKLVDHPRIPSSSFSTNTICFAGCCDDPCSWALDGPAIMPASPRISSSSSSRPESSFSASCTSSVRLDVKRSASALSWSLSFSIFYFSFQSERRHPGQVTHGAHLQTCCTHRPDVVLVLGLQDFHHINWETSIPPILHMHAFLHAYQASAPSSPCGT